MRLAVRSATSARDRPCRSSTASRQMSTPAAANSIALSSRRQAKSPTARRCQRQSPRPLQLPSRQESSIQGESFPNERLASVNRNLIVNFGPLMLLPEVIMGHSSSGNGSRVAATGWALA
jgi:hypothetical protein